MCETSRSNHPPSVDQWEPGVLAIISPTALPARASEACSGSTQPPAGPGERRFRRKISDRSWILNTLWGEERREMLGVCDDSQCWCCLDVWPYYGPRAVRETPSCGGRLSGGARVGGETRELAGWRHGENTAARQSVSTDTILLWQTSRHHTS